VSEGNPTAPYVALLARLVRPFPDFDFAFIKPLRAEAVALLALAPGARVLDAGCGPGGSLPFLVEAVGPSGEVVGIEISPEAAINARRRLARHRWCNVRILEAAAQSVELEGAFDGLLMFAAPDIYASEEALDNLQRHLVPGARVVFFGAKTSRRRGGWILNPMLRALFPRVSFRTTPVPDDAPWHLLAPRLEALTIREHFFGWLFLASGTWKAGAFARPANQVPGSS